MEKQTPLLILAGQALLFAAASLTHAGIIATGYEHGRAATAEGVIAAVLLAGLVVCLVRPAWTRAAALAAQGFALLGTLVGAFTIAIGIGPQTRADYSFHLILVVILLGGLAKVFRWDKS